MYYRGTGTDSDGVTHELAADGSSRSLNIGSACWATGFVATTSAPGSAILDWRFRCSESSDTAESEAHSPMRLSVVDAESPRASHSRPCKAVITTFSNDTHHVVSSRLGAL